MKTPGLSGQIRTVLLTCLILLTVCSRLPAENFPELLEAADANFRKGAFKEAIKGYQTVIAQDQTGLKAYDGLVRALLKIDDIDQARNVAQRAEQRFPGKAIPYVLLGDVDFRLGDFESAKTRYAKAFTLEGVPARAYLGMGKVLETECYRHSAAENFRKAHELDSNDPEVVRYWIFTLKSATEKISAYGHYLPIAGSENPNDTATAKGWLGVLKEIGNRRIFRLDQRPASAVIRLAHVIPDPRGSDVGLKLKVSLNGQKPEDLVLDTGASGLFISRKAAAKAGVKRLAETTIWGIGEEGGRNAYYGWADSIRIGDLEFKDCIVTVADKKFLATDVSGIIGTNVFKTFVVRINYKASALELTPLPTRSEAPSDLSEEWIEADRTVNPEFRKFMPVRILSDSLLLAPTSVNDKKRANFLIDTGSNMNLISQKLSKELTELKSSNWQVRGVSGKAEVQTARTIVLQFGRFRQENRNIVALDFSTISSDLGTEIGGIFGHNMLRSFTLVINYRDGLVDFVYGAP